MALKPDRIHVDSRIDYFMNQAAEPGGIACVLTGGSGVAMDQSVQAVHYPTSGSGVKPVGILMSKVVDLDLTRQHMNWHKEEVQKGGKVTIWQKGQVTTDHLVSGITPSVGDPVYVGADGRLTDVTAGGDVRVGTFDSTKDQDGFAKVSINLPVA